MMGNIRTNFTQLTRIDGKQSQQIYGTFGGFSLTHMQTTSKTSQKKNALINLKQRIHEKSIL